MLLVTRVDSRRVFVLGVAGLVPAALVTLLFVSQPSVGARRLYPMLRGSLTLVGLALALATLVTWATAPQRLSRSSLCGMAWAGVAALLCIGPFLESTPRGRLYAFELDTGDVAWARSGAAAAPVMVDGDLVVTDVNARSLVWLDPAEGHELQRESTVEPGDQVLVAEAAAAGAFIPAGRDAAPAPPPSVVVPGLTIVDGAIEGVGEDGEPWAQDSAGERVLAVARSGDSGYAYVSTPGADGTAGGAVVAFDAGDGGPVWRVRSARGGRCPVGNARPRRHARSHRRCRR